ncbi:MAG: RsmG family class I SAM-dependent methyltransferase, partial [Casimicrobiaceae bacterium]
MPSAESAISSAEIRRRLGALGFDVDLEQSAALEGFLALLLKWNKVYNLTGVRGADEIVDRHFVESFALRK